MRVTKAGIPYKKTGVPPRDTLAFALENSIPEPNSGCHLWLGPYDSYGYGVITTVARKWKAHRLLLIMHTPWQFERREACHRCDVPSCVNPLHLFWGTHADNMADAKKKVRTKNVPRLGIDHHKAKLSEEDVIAIRTSVLSSRIESANRGMDPSTIRDIRRRKIWRHI